MSGFTINAYRLTYTFQGSGIYSNTNTFSLNSNSVILFAFILAAAFCVAAFYFFLARVFTKVTPVSPGLMVAIHLGYRYPSLSLRFRHRNRILCIWVLFCSDCFYHFRHFLYLLFLVLETTYSICNADVDVHHGCYEEISVNDYRQLCWPFGDACFRRLVECEPC